MPTTVQFRRGTSTQNDAFTGAAGELSIDTTNKTIRVHDGSTAGGARLALNSERDDNLSVANATVLFANKMHVANVTSLFTTSDASIATKMAVSNVTSLFTTSDATVATNSATERSALANTNSYIATNSATERSALANTNAYIATNSATERSALANTNAYIAAVQSDVDTNEATERSALANTNAYIATNSATERSALANTNAYIATKSTWSGLTGTNTAIRTLVSDRMQVANVTSLFTTSDATAATKMAVANTTLLVNDRLQVANATTSFALKANLASPTLTGVPSAPTAANTVSTTQIATTAFVQNVVDVDIAALANSAPVTLNTLNELAAALGDDANFATTLSTNLGQKLGGTATVALTGDITASATAFSSNTVSLATSLAADSVDSAEIAASAVGASELNVTGNGTSGQFLASDGDGTMTWTTQADNDTTYSAGAGLDLTSTTFSVEPDLRDSITHIGLDAGDYIGWTNNLYQSFFVNAGERVRIEADGDIHADGDLIAYSTTISDRRLKDNIQPIEDALDKVRQLNGCTFTYIADGKESAGLIAQDVEKVLPSAVTEKELPLKMDDGKEYKVLQYDQTIGLLVEAIKEQQVQIEELQAKLK
jgi:hypothetical protein